MIVWQFMFFLGRLMDTNGQEMKKKPELCFQE